MARRRNPTNGSRKVRHGMAMGVRVAAAVVVAGLSGGALLASVALPSPAGAATNASASSPTRELTETVIGTPEPSPAPVLQEVGSGSGLVDSFRVVNTSTSPVKVVAYVPLDGRSVDDALTKAPAPGTVLQKDQYVVIEVTRYFGSETHLKAVFSWTTNPTVQYAVLMAVDGTFGVKDATCITNNSALASCEVHGFRADVYLR
jgi:hypothetical protein